MHIKLKDDREFEGSPLEIILAMKQTAIFSSGLDVNGYIDQVVANAHEFEGVELHVGSSEAYSTAVRSQHLVDEMIRAGLAVRA